MIHDTPFRWCKVSLQGCRRQLAQEVRLLSATKGALTWIVGAYYADERVRMYRDADLSALSSILGAGPPFVFMMNADQHTQASALFGQTEWSFATYWKLTTGARYTRERKDFDYRNDLLIGGPPLIPNASATGLSKTWNDLSGKIGLDFTPSDRVLLYATISKGFKSGGFPAGTTLSTSQVVPYDPEKLIAYELGVKTSSSDRRLRLNGAAFYYDYRDKQEFAYLPPAIEGAPPTQVLTNAGKARIYGAELDLAWRATERLEISGGLGLLDTSIVEFHSAAVADQAIAGNRLPNAPDTTVSARARYEIPLRNGSALTASTDLNYEGGVYFDIQNDRTRQEGGRTVVNASLNWVSGSRAWAAALWGRNLGNKAYKVDAQDFALGFLIDTYAPPRTYGATLSRRW